MDNNSQTASSMEATHIDKYRTSASCDTVHIERAFRIPEDITRILAYIFPVVFLIEFENIFSGKFLSETDGKI